MPKWNMCAGKWQLPRTKDRVVSWSQWSIEGPHWARLFTKNTGFPPFFILAFVPLINFDKPWKMTVIASTPVELNVKYTKEKKVNKWCLSACDHLKPEIGHRQNISTTLVLELLTGYFTNHTSRVTVKKKKKNWDLQEDWPSPLITLRVLICEFTTIKWFLY